MKKGGGGGGKGNIVGGCTRFLFLISPFRSQTDMIGQESEYPPCEAQWPPLSIDDVCRD